MKVYYLAALTGLVILFPAAGFASCKCYDLNGKKHEKGYRNAGDARWSCVEPRRKSGKFKYCTITTHSPIDQTIRYPKTGYWVQPANAKVVKTKTKIKRNKSRTSPKLVRKKLKKIKKYDPTEISIASESGR